MNDRDFLFLASMLRAREVGMLGEERISRLLDASKFGDAAKLLVDCGYPDMSEMSMNQINDALEARRSDIFHEISTYSYALGVLDLFRIKYDYHNVKVLVKSMGANVDAEYLLSGSGRIDAKQLTEAFITGQRGDLPPPVAIAMGTAVGILSRTGDPQLSDIQIDKAYFNELSSLAIRLKEAFITDYVQLLIDSANLRMVVRAARIGRGKDFLLNSLIPGGSVGVELVASSYDERNDSAPALYFNSMLVQAVQPGIEAMKGGTQTIFELACDNAVLRYATNTTFISFGPAPVIAYLSKVEWEITVVRMVLTGKYTGISPDAIRERLRECHV